MTDEEMAAKAVEYLAARGISGLTGPQAISKAIDIAVDEIVAKRLAESDGFFDFSGKNCEPYNGTECPGWDGESRRCECGNRRVYWAYSGVPFLDKDPYIYAEAY